MMQEAVCRLVENNNPGGERPKRLDVLCSVYACVLLSLWLQVYEKYLLWALKYINGTYFGLFGALGFGASNAMEQVLPLGILPSRRGLEPNVSAVHPTSSSRQFKSGFIHRGLQWGRAGR